MAIKEMGKDAILSTLNLSSYALTTMQLANLWFIIIPTTFLIIFRSYAAYKDAKVKNVTVEEAKIRLEILKMELATKKGDTIAGIKKDG